MTGLRLFAAMLAISIAQAALHTLTCCSSSDEPWALGLHAGILLLRRKRAHGPKGDLPPPQSTRLE
ncbi:hypothetical protein CTA1_10675 [Colletotrichum tanaceti]|uniref:Uncharacterized protein n=1 Tax=Colletotrichum tanaceti TaxID=1306861 RepID=A0A4V6DJ68_9PEZI|nr:hypothetical protein CTA1_10675 [Colletotrichum tanaceti]